MARVRFPCASHSGSMMQDRHIPQGFIVHWHMFEEHERANSLFNV
jgi:hypothetical protein